MSSQTAPASLNNLDPIDQEYLRAEQMLSGGQLNEAAAICQGILETNPNYARGYFFLGKIYNAVGNVDKTLEFANRAIELSPQDDASFFYLKGNALLQKDRLDEAEIALKHALTLNRSFPLAALFLGTICIKKNETKRAHEYLNMAANLGLEAESLEQRALLFQNEGRKDEAMAALNRVIELRPDHPTPYVLRGNLHMDMEHVSAAEQDAMHALSLNRNHERAWVLATLVASHKKNYEEALIAIQQAIRVNPEDMQSWHLLARTLMRAGRVPDSIEIYKEILNRKPQDSVALQQLPSLLIVMGQLDESRMYLDRALAVNPDSSVLNHFKAVLDGGNLEGASESYVQEVFDGYAQEFDYQLQEKLQYKTPEKLAEALRKVMRLEGDASAELSLLDLGCGTGLGAVALKSLTTRRVGMDLSPKMLEKARARNLYDELHTAEIKAYLTSENRTFDLVAAVDVFVYIGNLAPIFEATRAVLTQTGYFAFSVERDDSADKGYTLRTSGRFAHSAEYLKGLADQYGYKIELIEPSVIRYEANQPMEGYLVILTLKGSA
jgi:predicted TPR repeat methyltransferase